MFLLSKLLDFFSQPLCLAGLLLAGGLWRMPRTATGRGWCAAAFVVLVLTGWKPLPDLGLRLLENQYPEIAPQDALADFAGVVVLGGALEAGYVAQDHAQPLLTSSAERMTAAVALLRSHPEMKAIFSGGEGHYFGTGPSESARAEAFFSSQGVAAPRVQYEHMSRNTFDNAQLSARLPGIDPRQHWLLITSAWHMPRSMAAFEKAGWQVTAYPVDYRTGQSTPWTEYSLQEGANHWQLLLHELLGLASYRLSGRI
jgi:uncharacterized SAM-binding protein YcdF (DUF218 family)